MKKTLAYVTLESMSLKMPVLIIVQMDSIRWAKNVYLAALLA